MIKAFLGCGFFNLKSHDSCRSDDSERLKSKTKRSMSLKFTSLLIKHTEKKPAGVFQNIIKNVSEQI